MKRSVLFLLIMTITLLTLAGCAAPKQEQDAATGPLVENSPEQGPTETTNEPSYRTEEALPFGTDPQRTITVKNNRVNDSTAYPLSFDEKKQLIQLLNKGERKEYMPLLATDLLLNIDGDLWHYDTTEGLAFGAIPNAHIVFDLETTKQINELLLAQFEANTNPAETPNKKDESPEPVIPQSGASTPKEPNKTQEPFHIEDLLEETMTLKANFASGKESPPLLISKADKAAIINLLNAAQWKPDILKLATDLHLYIGKSKYYFDPYEGHLHVTLSTGGYHTRLDPESTLQLNAILTPYLENNLEILTDLKHNGRFWLLEEDITTLKALFTKYPEETLSPLSCEHQFSIDGTNYQYHRDSGSIFVREKATGFILNEADRQALNTLLDKYPKFSS